MEFPNAWGGKISMPPVIGVRIFSGTTKSCKPTSKGVCTPPSPGAKKVGPIVHKRFHPRRLEGGFNLPPPPPSLNFSALNFCSLADYQKLWHNSLFVKTCFDTIKVMSRVMTSL